jgi:hypothetical protein
VRWAVWRRSYLSLNRNASAVSTGLGLSESVEAQHRRVVRQGMVWSGRWRRGDPQWEGPKFLSILQVRLFVYCSSSSIPHFLSIFLYLLNICFPPTFIFASSNVSSFSCFYSATIQLLKHSFLLRFCGYHRRTEIHATASYAWIVGLNHDFFDGCVGSANLSICYVYLIFERPFKLRSTSVPTVSIPYYPQRPLLHTLRHLLIVLFTNWVLPL